MIDSTSFHRDVLNFVRFFNQKFSTDIEEVGYSLIPLDSYQDEDKDIFKFGVYVWARKNPVHDLLTFLIYEDESITVLETGDVLNSNVEFHDYLESLEQDESFNHKVQNLFIIMEHDK